MAKSKRQIIIASIILLFALIFGISIGAITWIIQDTPDISSYKGTNEASMIYSADGQLLTKLYRQNRTSVPLEQIPADLKNAIIAVEDTNFYVHHGVDFWGIIRAVITNISNLGSRPQGASTITQQLAGNALLNRQNVSYYRKIQEAYLALQFERHYTKPEILEMYLNEIYLGHSAYGVEIAAQQYFNKHVWELNLSESALIAGLPKSPNYYSPFNNFDEAIRRRNIVLNRMQEVGYITEKKAQEAKQYEVKLRSKELKQEELAPYFIRYIRDQLIDRFGAQLVYDGGLKVYTTLDPIMQKAAEDAVTSALKDKYIPSVERENTADKLQPQMAIISIDPTTGAIRAMLGGRGNDQFNRAVQAVRQPGSAFKPFVYTTAIKNGYTTSYVVNDMPMLAKSEKGKSLRIWPNNTAKEYRGYVSLRTALNHSINVAAVKLLQEVGVDNTINTTKEMGISTFETADGNKEHLSLALGGLTRGVTPLEMASAYGIFANQGILVEPIAVTKVLDKNDNVIYEAHPRKKIVLKEDTAYIMTNMLQSVVNNGTGWRARINRRAVAGKTGTTNGYSDAWFVGFTPDLVTSVWIGEDNVTPMEYNQKDEQGNYLFPEGSGGRIVSSSEAVRLWGNYMREAVKDMPVKDFKVPANITKAEVDPVTGLLPNEYTPRTVQEIFRKGNVPTEVESLHQATEKLSIDKESGLLATANCPEENIVEYEYFVDSGYRVGPATIHFKQKADKDKDPEDEELIEGVYHVAAGEPVQKIDPETGVPERDETGQVIYETKPTQYCDLHGETDNFINSIWDFFNRF
ncbi:PBP1A family penicillin-binding protein [Iocasia frigidifontis]|uniref:Penicillin-binding protein 1A n=1 Tax=Iocasia fonsfrigidae TaxID=2682810 RepID=A0A8A7K9Y5_9FIRM|nr:PBP1A family penicillin-binding protein [Iocasia fonsfrigidae]QTL98576.1 PBP1A family penicillin-binding protein [Iocasia fonsfrigidae]